MNHTTPMYDLSSLSNCRSSVDPPTAQCVQAGSTALHRRNYRSRVRTETTLPKARPRARLALPGRTARALLETKTQRRCVRRDSTPSVARARARGARRASTARMPHRDRRRARTDTTPTSGTRRHAIGTYEVEKCTANIGFQMSVKITRTPSTATTRTVVEVK